MCESQASKDWRESIHKVIAEPTPTPSITVGTQVRLTGVVTGPTSKRDGAIGVQIEGATAPADMIFVVPASLEVIRQPFKRGEIIYAIDDPDPWLVVADEKDGWVSAIIEKVQPGYVVVSLNVDFYERRP